MNQAEQQSEREALCAQITAYLSGGGLWNPELADHIVVRDMLIACRAALSHPSTGQWKLVPVQMTEAMKAAFGHDWDQFAWEAALNAAPPPPQGDKT